MTDDPKYTLPPSLQDTIKLIGYDPGKEASYSFASIEPSEKIEFLNVPHKQVDLVRFQTNFLAGIASQLGLTYEQVSGAWNDSENYINLLWERRERLLPKIENLLANGDPRRRKRAWRLWASTWGSYTPSAGFDMLVDRARMRRFAQQMIAAQDAIYIDFVNRAIAEGRISFPKGDALYLVKLPTWKNPS